MSEPVVWLADGSPHSPRFNDRYRTSSGGLAQAFTVFLAGCGLPEGWRGNSRFTVLETGFGLGLNFLTTWAAWEADAQRCDCLRYAAIEGYPVAPAAIVRSAHSLSPPTPTRQVDVQRDCPGLLARVPVLAQELAQVWHDVAPGIHRFAFADGRVQLTLAVGEACPMLERLLAEVGGTAAADAVYLDGFSPALNPEMWSAPTLKAVARHCHLGTRLATYSVAKSVREGLAQLGFRVEKCPGLPPKRQRLQALLLASMV